MDCKWTAHPPSSVVTASIVDPSDGSVKENIFVVENNYVYFTGLRLSFEELYTVEVLNTSTSIRLFGKLYTFAKPN